MIPSILTSRFPKHFRFLAGALAYNGGLVISFASPFLIQQQVILNNQNYYYVLFSMFLGGLSVTYGSWQILRNFLHISIRRMEKSGYFELRLPSPNSQWGKYNKKWENSKREFKIIQYNTNKNEKWIMSIYFAWIKRLLSYGTNLYNYI